jgi:uncharacterized protein YkwD
MLTRRRFSVIVLGSLIGAMGLEVMTQAGTNDDVIPANVGSFWPNTNEWSMLSHINKWRYLNGAPRLEMSRSLAAAARHHAYYMAHTDDVDHSLDINWNTNIYSFGYPQGYVIGENVAAGRQYASQTLEQWKLSPAHNENVLNPKYIRAGIGRVYFVEGKYDFYWVATFGSVSHRTIFSI